MRTPIRLLPALAVAITAVAFLVLRAEPPPQAKRVPWTTSRITGSPEAPPPYRTERVFPKLKFAEPVTITRAPGSERLFVAQLRGKIVSFPDDQACEKPDPFLDLGAIPGHWRTYGLVFHPNFAKNRFVYACYVLKAGDPKGSRVSRFKVTDTDPPRADPKSETILLEWPSGGHNGGCLQFGPDDFLYISTGDGSNPNPPDALNTGQDISDLLSSILRIDVDHEDPGKAYRIPPDNPFVKTEGARPEIWAYGLRNPWKMTFDRPPGDLCVGDVGWDTGEMVHRVQRGGNYGWSVMEGRLPIKSEGKRGPTPILPPTLEFPHSEAASITGGYVYHGKRYPDLAGAYICGDYVTGKIWATRFQGDKVLSHREIAQTGQRIVAFGEDKDGEFYYVNHDEKEGALYRLVPQTEPDTSARFPRRLSETGLFADTAKGIPAPGVVAFAINAEQWADLTTAERWIGLPG